MRWQRLSLIATVLLGLVIDCSQAWNQPTNILRRVDGSFKNNANEHEELERVRPPHEARHTNRRSLLQRIAGTGIGASCSLWLPSPASALMQPTLNMNCLDDLPPPSDTTAVRLYLCRHGQTENNRLRLVQGSRVNAALNSNGQLMAQRMGEALTSTGTNMDCICHSPLLRAQETAQIASLQISKLNRPPLQVMNDLVEVDFGPVADGQPAQPPSSMKIYSQWAAGNLNARPDGGEGESGNEVLQRCASALTSILTSSTASTTGGTQHVTAVAHSAYIRILLAMVLEESLALGVTRRIANAGITVIDLDRSKTVVPKLLRRGRVHIPKPTVVRINEGRHLEGVPTT